MKQRICKIGIGMYEATDDKNGGMHEFNLIKEALGRVRYELEARNAFVIVGGKLDHLEERSLLAQLDDYSTKIFIATDSVNFDTCGNIIKQCTHLLHQSWMPNINIFPEANIEKYYSWVPELFYNPSFMTKPPKLQHERCIFGGGVNGREDKIAEYVLDCSGERIMPHMFAIMKDTTGDQRIPYNEFQKLMGMHKYSLCICREAYRDIGWITPRFIEAIAAWNYPMCDIDYDKGSHFLNNENKFSSSDKLRTKMNWTPEHRRIEKIKEYRARFHRDRTKFVEVVLKCLQQ